MMLDEMHQSQLIVNMMNLSRIMALERYNLLTVLLVITALSMTEPCLAKAGSKPKPDSLQQENRLKVSSDTEYGYTELDDPHPSSYLYNMTKLVLGNDLYDIALSCGYCGGHTYVTNIWFEQYYLPGNVLAAELLFRYKMPEGWNIGLAARAKEDWITTDKYRHYLKFFIENNLPYQDGLSNLTVSFEQSLHTTGDFSNGYDETGYFAPDKFYANQDHLLEVDYSFINHASQDNRQAPENLPLLLARQGTFLIHGKGDYTFANRRDVVDGARLYYSVPEFYLNYNHKLLNWLEVNSQISISHYLVEKRQNESFHQTTSWLAGGLTCYPLSYKGLQLLTGATYKRHILAQEISIVAGSAHTKIDEFLTPPLVLVYRYNHNLLVSAMLSRLYFLNDPSQDNEDFLKRKWDCILATTLRF